MSSSNKSTSATTDGPAVPRKRPDEPITPAEVRERLAKEREKETPADQPEPYELNITAYPGNALFQTDKTPGELREADRMIAKLYPPHVGTVRGNGK